MIMTCPAILRSLLLLILCLGLPERLLAGQELILVGPEFPPYYQHDAQGRVSGELVRLYDIIVRHAGYHWRGYIVPTKRVMKSLADGHFNSSILVKNPLLEQSGTVLTSPDPVSEMILNLYFHTGRFSDIESFTVSKDLMKNSKVAVMRGYGYGGMRSWLAEPENKITTVELDNFSSAIRLLESGRVDFALLYDVNFQAGQKELHRKAMNISSATLAHVPLYFHISTSIKNTDQVMDRLMNSYRDLVAKGILASAYHQPHMVIQ
ncbi:transporter substrate-binding domain-containing protein [Oceanospirillum sediminis]|uniref:Transporter substrate-binding domain-containing protein n=1 Tax=Oceanospirillum sediminis TaxID=2760088 RepID=A0A839IWQ5_9GAMM|nr:transporter substrate-binding domain-containing protein [Oceanospirillum sediminis]MBB1489202.1 transporter substrate-binding domain-containing protein [Oceanospirillum sediminis]